MNLMQGLFENSKEPFSVLLRCECTAFKRKWIVSKMTTSIADFAFSVVKLTFICNIAADVGSINKTA